MQQTLEGDHSASESEIVILARH